MRLVVVKVLLSVGTHFFGSFFDSWSFFLPLVEDFAGGVEEGFAGGLAGGMDLLVDGVCVPVDTSCKRTTSLTCSFC